MWTWHYIGSIQTSKLFKKKCSDKCQSIHAQIVRWILLNCNAGCTFEIKYTDDFLLFIVTLSVNLATQISKLDKCK